MAHFFVTKDLNGVAAFGAGGLASFGFQADSVKITNRHASIAIEISWDGSNLHGRIEPLQFATYGGGDFQRTRVWMRSAAVASAPADVEAVQQ